MFWLNLCNWYSRWNEIAQIMEHAFQIARIYMEHTFHFQIAH